MSGFDEPEPILLNKRSRFGRARGAKIRVERSPLDVVLRLAVVLSVLLLVVIGVKVWLDSYGFGSGLVAIKHIAAGRGCTDARAVGLAPARIGEPGYWPALDRNGNGQSCEVTDAAS